MPHARNSSSSSTDSTSTSSNDALPDPDASTVRYRGITYEQSKKLWRARVYVRGKHVTLGRYPTSETAARAHDAAMVFLFGQRATTNFRCVRPTASNPLPFGTYAKKQLLALRDDVTRADGCDQKDAAQLLRAQAAAVAFSLGRQAHAVTTTTPNSSMCHEWPASVFRIAIAVAARLPP